MHNIVHKYLSIKACISLLYDFKKRHLNTIPWLQCVYMAERIKVYKCHVMVNI